MHNMLAQFIQCDVIRIPLTITPWPTTMYMYMYMYDYGYQRHLSMAAHNML